MARQTRERDGKVAIGDLLNWNKPPTPVPARKPAAEPAEEEGGRALALLTSLYRPVIGGFGGRGAVSVAAAEGLLRAEGDVERAVRETVRRTALQAGAAGFMTGLGGLVTLPVALPANVVSVLALQTRLVATIACLHGHDPESEGVRRAVMLAVVGLSLADFGRGSGVRLGTRMSLRLLDRLPATSARALNKMIGQQLANRLASLTLGKAAPVVGCAIGGGMDWAGTRAVGLLADKTFRAVPTDNATDGEGAMMADDPRRDTIRMAEDVFTRSAPPDSVILLGSPDRER
ncbi:hypothetical protein Rru_A1694 [Rhodospirillum rubrum ATCC 11170]|uniref:EcsC family protein n=1 Tax=Rhodospirillum rubrum (strain ATCC 11170 / ATH 1.1.1 / DSM 467 / LMG 4362 / NCIMB 8255 / S1) TaxID=269796 RepID=Q2RTQ1_RHORT|nr:hypothetical protein Rru_A1694 [Rhodospirillum rubrum ATCC 11170]MBK5954082.1 hypothetical protein [Rhodospirillum rubrum]